MKKTTAVQASSSYCPKIWDANDLYAAMRTHGDKVALRYIEGGKVKSMTYRSFCDNILDMAAGLDALGLSGKRIALIGENSPKWLTAYIAVLAMEALDIDSEGLDSVDKKILEALIDKFSGGPVGMENLAIAVSQEADSLSDVIEPYLIKAGFITRTPRGRVATAKAYKHLGRKMTPEGGLF